MKKTQKHKTFYVELSLEEIKIATQHSVSIYPVWLGKNRAIIRDVVGYFNKHHPETLFECLDIIGRFGMHGQGTSETPIKENFISDEKSIDKDRIFW